MALAVGALPPLTAGWGHMPPVTAPPSTSSSYAYACAVALFYATSLYFDQTLWVTSLSNNVACFCTINQVASSRGQPPAF